MAGKCAKAASVGARIALIFGLLYVFICSLDLLSVSFRLISGKAAGDLLGSDSLLGNPIVGLMLGVLGTVCVQSSSTFTSIVISMVGGGILSPHDAVYMVMGSNVGTSVTSTIVSLTQSGDREQFRRAFAAATVHDAFNWLTVIVMLIVEVATGLLEAISDDLAEIFVGSGGTDAGDVKILKYITEPLTDLVVQINSTVMEEWALGGCENCSLMQRICPDEDFVELDGSQPKCKYLFNVGELAELSDAATGAILAVASLVVLCLSLMLMVKVLNSLLQGAIAKAVRKVLNPNFDSRVAGYFYGYVEIVIGAAMTFIVQSSSVFTSTLTPLVGLDLLTVETVYPLFLGSNLGTTTTGLLAALATMGSGIHDALQIAFVHLFFNLFGIAIFFPIPAFRPPINLCKVLGKTTARYRWFAVLYLVVMFVLLPAFVMVCSLNDVVFAVAMSLAGAAVLSVAAVSAMQRHPRTAKLLPGRLRDWSFLPEPLRSLEPYDRLFARASCCRRMFENGGEKRDVDEDDDDGSLRKEPV